MKRLNSIYVEDQAYLSGAQQLVYTFTMNYKQDLHDRYDWYVKDQNWPNDKAFDYFLNSRDHKAQLSNYRDMIEDIIRFGSRIRDKAVVNYMIIRHLLNDESELPKFVKNYGISGDPVSDRYDGVYVTTDEQGEESRARLSSDYGILLWEAYEDQTAFYFSEILLSEANTDTLVFSFSTSFHMTFERDSNGVTERIKAFSSDTLSHYYTPKKVED